MTRSGLLSLSIAVLVAGPPPAGAQVPRADLVLANVTVIDGRGGAARPGRAVALQGDRIVAVTAADSAPPAANRLDLTGHWVIPGLIDSHVHLPSNRDSVVARLEALLDHGITTVRDLAGDALLYQALQLTPVDQPARSRLFYGAFVAGPSWFAADPRPRGATRGREPGTVPWFLAVTDTTDLDMAVAAAKRLGVTAVKIYSDLTVDLVAEITREAHRQGLMVWSHPAVFPVRPSEVVRAGADVISHAALLAWEAVDTLPARFHTDPWTNFGPVAPYQRIPPDTAPVRRVLSLMRERGTILDATVSTITAGISPIAAEWACAVTRGALRMGVRVSTGTDRRSPINGQPALLDEIAYLVDRCGFTRMEVLTAATLNGAATVGRGHELGTVEPGRLADLVVLRGDPLADLAHLRSIAYVVRGGRLVVPRIAHR